MKIVKGHDDNLVIILVVFIRLNVCPCESGMFCWCLILACFFRFEYSQKIIIASPRCFGRFCRGADWGMGIYRVGDNFWWEWPTKDNNRQILGGECSIGLQLATRGPTLNRIGVVISTSHLKVKYPLDDGVLIGTITANQELARKCHEESLKNQRKWYGDQTGHQVNVLNLNPRKDFEEWRQTSTKDVKEKAMAERTMVKLGTTLPLEIETELILTLKEKHRVLHMEFSRYVWNQSRFHMSSTGFRPKGQTNNTKKKEVQRGKEETIVEGTKKLVKVNHIQEINTRSSWLTLSWSRKQTKDVACALTLSISTRHVSRIHAHYWTSIAW